MSTLTNFRTSPFTKDEWFNNFLNDSFLTSKSSFKKSACNISEDKDNFYCELEAPGFKKEEISISLDEGVLTVSGNHEEVKCDDRTYHLEERSCRSFKRSFSLPKGVKGESVGAKYEAGILKITLPKDEVQKPKLISVE